MSVKNPIVAITGSSGAGTTTVMKSFQHIFRREGIRAQILEGDSMHRYNRMEMREQMKQQQAAGNLSFSHFSPDANLLGELADGLDAMGSQKSFNCMGQALKLRTQVDRHVMQFGLPSLDQGQARVGAPHIGHQMPIHHWARAAC